MIKFGDITSFFQDITNFIRRGSVIGVDIGTSSIKIAEISEKSGQLRLDNYSILETRDYLKRPNLALQTNSLPMAEQEVARLLRLAIVEAGIESNTAVVSAPIFSSFVTVLDMPQMSNKETERSIDFQAGRYIPIPLSEALVDWTRVDEYTTPQGVKFQRILLVGVPKRVVDSLKRVCKMAGLRLIAVELESLAMVRAMPKTTKPTLIVDIGAQSTSAAVADGGFLKYAEQTDYSGIHLTRGISKALDLAMKRAEDLKKESGLLGQDGRSELSTLILPFLDVIIQEVGYVKNVYEKRYGRSTEQMILAGGGADLKGIAEYFSQQLKLSHVPPGTFSEIIYPTKIEPAMASLRKQLPIAVGLARRYFQE